MNSHLAYIVMPVGSDKTFESKRALIEASARNKGWATHFPLDTELRADAGAVTKNFVLSEVIAEMKAASLIIADLSLERPSCYYELGVAQALGRPTFLLAAAGTAIHQVADREKINFYAGLNQLSEMVTAALNKYGA